MSFGEILKKLVKGGLDSETPHALPSSLAEELSSMTDIYDSRLRHRGDELIKYSIMVRIVH